MATHSTEEIAVTDARRSRSNAKLAGFYIAILATVGLLVAFVGDRYPLLVLGWYDASVIADLEVHRFHIMGIRLFVAVPSMLVLSQPYRSRANGAALLAAIVIFAIVSITFAVIGMTEDVIMGVIFGVPTVISALVHPSGRKLLARGDHRSPALVGLLLLAVVPLALHIAGQFTVQLTQSAQTRTRRVATTR